MQSRTLAEAQLDGLLIKNLEANLFQAAFECLEKGADPSAKSVSGESALLIAAGAGYVEMLSALIAKGANKKATHVYINYNCNALARAAQNGHEKAVELLLQHRFGVSFAVIMANKNKHNNIVALIQNYLYLHEAFIANVKAGIEVGIHACLEKGVDLDCVSTDELAAPAIYFAARLPNTDVLQLLIDRGANLQMLTKDGETALHAAVRAGNLASSSLLLKLGVDPYARPSKSISPAQLAAREHQCDILDLFATKIPANPTDIIIEGMPRIMDALKDDGPEQYATVKWLLDHNWNVDKRDDEGATPLHQCIKKQNVDLTKLLLERGANINITWDKSHGWRNTSPLTPLDHAKNTNCKPIIEMLTAAHENKIALTLKFLQCIRDRDHAGAKEHIASAMLNYSDARFATAICEAVVINDLKMMTIILEADADVSADKFTERRLSPLHVAAFHNLDEAAALLLEHDASVNAEVKNAAEHCDASPLHLAAHLGHTNVLAVLLSAKSAQIDRVAFAGGMTALYLAVAGGHASAVTLLLEKGANPSFIPNKQPSILEFSVSNNKLEIAKLIVIALLNLFIEKKATLRHVIGEIAKLPHARATLIAHLIMTWLDYPDSLDEAEKATFLDVMVTRFTPNDRDDIKKNLLSMTKEIACADEKLTLCKQALDPLQSNPLSVMLNIKRRMFYIGCDSERGTLGEFKHLHLSLTEVKPAAKPAAKPVSLYDEQMLNDLRATIKTTITSRNALMIENNRHMLADLYQQERHAVIEVLILDLERAAQQEMILPTAPPLMSVSPSQRGVPGLFDAPRMAQPPTTSTTNRYG